MSRGVNCMAGCRLEVKMKRLQAVAAAGAAGRVPGVATPPACALTPPPFPRLLPRSRPSATQRGPRSLGAHPAPRGPSAPASSEFLSI